MAKEFTDYSHQELPAKKIKKYAEQYEDSDLISFLDQLKGHPFLFGSDENILISSWCSDSNKTYNAIIEDSVLNYALIQFMKRNNYPLLASDADIEDWVVTCGW